MSSKLNCVLLIDDDKITNSLNEMVLNQLNCTNEIKAVNNGMEALDYLMSNKDGRYPAPDLIFLDINMPGMDGWEFMEEYEKLPPEIRGNVILVMLTTSLNPDDREMAGSFKAINDFVNKPLTRALLIEVLTKNFPQLELTVS